MNKNVMMRLDNRDDLGDSPLASKQASKQGMIISAYF